MTHAVSASRQALAPALAMMVAANGRIDERELGVLEALDAFDRVGVSRARFVEIAEACLSDVGTHLHDRSWLSTDHVHYINTLLDAVATPEDRILVCRLAAAVVTADGQVTHDERLVYDHALARWRIRQSEVTRAILQDRQPRGQAAPA